MSVVQQRPTPKQGLKMDETALYPASLAHGEGNSDAFFVHLFYVARKLEDRDDKTLTNRYSSPSSVPGLQGVLATA
ncbi:hypothetical protein FA13DRAFT_1731553 [Coprinellus micaceus]|uniref:Uncharacterized protein n=1 Tax=Coprinellus micaceus TaxID=71717 RepID=A0A4Y7TFS4_COPMI|nr:hypothetical protein FA13DRAFT_1731553 [Coprinellus micaceus]